MCPSSRSRAVSAVFRLFGGEGGRCEGDACLHTEYPGMHGWERMALAVWMPFSVLVAAADACHHWMGDAGFLLAIPAWLFLLHLLPYALGGVGPASQWRRWLLLGGTWVCFRMDAGGVTGLVSRAWLVLLAVNLAAVCLIQLKRLLERGNSWRMFVGIAAHLLVIAAGWRWGWQIGVAGGALLAGGFCWVVLNPRSRFLGPLTDRHAGPGVRITIDDGPDPVDTPVLLDLLDRYQAKAIFFMIGEKAAAHPELAREVLRRGHEIGNHTMTHPQASFWCAGPARTRREIDGCQRVIEEITGVKPRWFRAPVGHRNWFTHPIVRELGLEVMAWNRRGYDAVEKDADKVLGRILPHLRNGDIVLLHEATPIAAVVLEGVLRRLSFTPASSSRQ